MRPEIRNIIPKEKGRLGLLPKAAALPILIAGAIIASNEDTFAEEDLNVVTSGEHQVLAPKFEEYATMMVAREAYTIGFSEYPDLSVINLNPADNPEIVAKAQSFSGSVSPIIPSEKILVEIENPDIWTVLADCETGDGQVGPPFYVTWGSKGEFEGAFQFLNSTWKSLQASEGYEHAYDAPPAVQIKAAQELLARGGWPQWPSCSQRMIAAGYIK